MGSLYVPVSTALKANAHCKMLPSGCPSPRETPKFARKDPDYWTPFLLCCAMAHGKLQYGATSSEGSCEAPRTMLHGSTRFDPARRMCGVCFAASFVPRCYVGSHAVPGSNGCNMFSLGPGQHCSLVSATPCRWRPVLLATLLRSGACHALRESACIMCLAGNVCLLRLWSGLAPCTKMRLGDARRSFHSCQAC